MILAGDVGGTHTRLALFDKEGCKDLRIYASRLFANLDLILKDYLSDKKNLTIESLSLAVAGPILQGICHVTNLPWIIDSQEIQRNFCFSNVFLLNDLEANAYAITVLPKESLYLLHKASEIKAGNRIVVSPGTGLGESAVFWDGQNYHPFASEGGHVDFAPVGDLQIELYKYLQSQYEHVSFEIPLSGPGLSHIYQFLLDVKKRREEPFLIEHKKDQDLSLLISTHGIQKDSQICSEALDIFCDLLAQETANFALKILAYGGIYLGGGIVPQILPKLADNTFLNRFFHKGHFRALLEKMPLYAITDDTAALKGAAHFGFLSSLQSAH